MTSLAETCTYAHDGWPFPFLIPAIVITILLVTRPWRRRRHCGPSGESLLADRFARGEIDEDEYRTRKSVLRDK